MEGFLRKFWVLEERRPKDSHLWEADIQGSLIFPQIFSRYLSCHKTSTLLIIRAKALTLVWWSNLGLFHLQIKVVFNSQTLKGLNLLFREVLLLPGVLDHSRLKDLVELPLF